MSRSMWLPVGVGVLVAIGLYVNWKQANSGVTYVPAGSVRPEAVYPPPAVPGGYGGYIPAPPVKKPPVEAPNASQPGR